jgi:hypothetical protein
MPLVRNEFTVNSGKTTVVTATGSGTSDSSGSNVFTSPGIGTTANIVLVGCGGSGNFTAGGGGGEVIVFQHVFQDDNDLTIVLPEAAVPGETASAYADSTLNISGLDPVVARHGGPAFVSGSSSDGFSGGASGSGQRGGGGATGPIGLGGGGQGGPGGRFVGTTTDPSPGGLGVTLNIGSGDLAQSYLLAEGGNGGGVTLATAATGTGPPNSGFGGDGGDGSSNSTTGTGATGFFVMWYGELPIPGNSDLTTTKVVVKNGCVTTVAIMASGSGSATFSYHKGATVHYALVGQGGNGTTVAGGGGGEVQTGTFTKLNGGTATLVLPAAPPLLEVAPQVNSQFIDAGSGINVLAKFGEAARPGQDGGAGASGSGNLGGSGNSGGGGGHGGAGSSNDFNGDTLGGPGVDIDLIFALTEQETVTVAAGGNGSFFGFNSPPTLQTLVSTPQSGNGGHAGGATGENDTPGARGATGYFVLWYSKVDNAERYLPITLLNEQLFVSHPTGDITATAVEGAFSSVGLRQHYSPRAMSIATFMLLNPNSVVAADFVNGLEAGLSLQFMARCIVCINKAKLVVLAKSLADIGIVLPAISRTALFQIV